MAYDSKLPVSISEVLAHARAIAFQISNHTARLSMASGRRITAKTATRLQELADEVQRIDIERERGAVGSKESLVREGQQLITSIATAARFAGIANPDVAHALMIARLENRGRASGAVWFALYHHGEVVKAHKKVLSPILPKTILKDIDRVRAALIEHDSNVKNRRMARADVTKHRAELIRELRAIVGETRALAAALFRNEPEIERQFQMPKRRTPRKSRVADPAPE